MGGDAAGLPAMAALFATGRVVDLVLAGVAAEALLLAWLFRGRALGGLLANLASGACLMLALRAALVGAPWPSVAGWMLAGLAGHGADLALRLRAGRYAASVGRLGRERPARPRVHAGDGLERL